jgi:DUF4097 and DUF4098 domain-containing protein YvlB
VARARFDQLFRTCTNTITGSYGRPLIASGVTCLDGATVSGPISVPRGASLLALDATISGPVSAASAEAVHLYETTVRGPVSVSGTTGSVALVDSSINGPVSLAGNRTGDVEPVVSGNTIRGPLACSGNAPAPLDLGEPNSVSGPAAGQCSSLD